MGASEYKVEGERTVGLELEYAGVSIERTIELIQGLYGGEVEVVNDVQSFLRGSSLGDFRVELDAKVLKYLASRVGSFGAEGVVGAVTGSLWDFVHRAGMELVPFEIVMPPVKMSQLPELDRLREVLCEEGAKGTKERVRYIFGLHFNPQVKSLDVEYILNILRSYLLLSPWLKKKHEVDLARRLSIFIEPFPDEYERMVLDEGYSPTMGEFVLDYYKHNSTRNRGLDLLPLLSYIDEELVSSLWKRGEKINKRPTFHYRLPNSEIEDVNWSFMKEWEFWLAIESLVEEEQRLNTFMDEWQKHRDSWFRTKRDWIEFVKKEIR